MTTIEITERYPYIQSSTPISHTNPSLPPLTKKVHSELPSASDSTGPVRMYTCGYICGYLGIYVGVNLCAPLDMRNLTFEGWKLKGEC